MALYKLMLPLTFFVGSAIGYFSWSYSLNKDVWSFLFLWFFNIIPISTWIYYCSKKLLLDQLLYNVCLTISYLIVILVIGQGEALSLINWLGLMITLSGFILIRLKCSDQGRIQL